MKSSHQKHMVYYEVLESFQKGNTCAMCDLEIRDVRRYLESILYEYVNDAGVRKDLIRSRGYCHRHAHMLLELGDGLGTAILYHEQAVSFLNSLVKQNSLSGKLGLKSMPEIWNNGDICPACRNQMQSRNRYINTFLKWLHDAEMQKVFTSSPGLCVPHLLVVLSQTNGSELKQYLLEKHVDKFKILEKELAEFIRKQDYRFSREPMGAEKDSWQRAVTLMAGMKDVF